MIKFSSIPASLQLLALLTASFGLIAQPSDYCVDSMQCDSAWVGLSEIERAAVFEFESGCLLFI